MMVSFDHSAAYNKLLSPLYLDEFLPDDESQPYIDLNATSYTDEFGAPNNHGNFFKYW